jgi:hypothetical protein
LKKARKNLTKKKKRTEKIQQKKELKQFKKRLNLSQNIVEKQNEKSLQAIDDTLNAVEERQSHL